MSKINSKSSSVQSTLSHQVQSSSPGLAPRKRCCVENVGDVKSETDDELRVESSKDSFDLCVDEEEYWDKLEDDKSKPRCDHKYEVGVVVVNISSEYLHLVGPLGHAWVETCVDPFHSLVFVDGVRIKEVFSVKIGAMGNMVVKECVKCQIDTTVSELSIAFPTLLWFGEEQKPSVRGAVGVVNRWEGRRMVVQLEQPPAARIARLVLFHPMGSLARTWKLRCRPRSKVLVWAWARQLEGGVRIFLEGAAAVVKIEDGQKV